MSAAHSTTVLTPTQTSGRSPVDHEIERILDELDAAAVDVDVDIREASRHPLRGQAICMTMLGQPSAGVLHVRIRNLSSNGIAFVSGLLLVPGTRVRLAIPSSATTVAADRCVIVRRVRRVCSHLFEMGAEFLDCNATDESTVTSCAFG